MGHVHVCARTSEEGSVWAAERSMDRWRTRSPEHELDFSEFETCVSHSHKRGLK